VRDSFRSFGTCSIREPLDDLAHLDLLPPGVEDATEGRCGMRLSVSPDDPFGLHNLPYGVYRVPGASPRVGTRLGDHVVDLALLLDDEVFATGSLNAFMAQGPGRWAAVRSRIAVGARDVTLHLPFEVADYVDFYASEHHATNVGRIFRPDGDALTPNWKHLPIGYHGRAGTVVVSGTDVVRPSGQRLPPGEAPRLRAEPAARHRGRARLRRRRPSALGSVPVGEVRGARLRRGAWLNDWSARDIQAWEYVPLGPFLGKSFATSISPWVVRRRLRAVRHPVGADRRAAGRRAVLTDLEACLQQLRRRRLGPGLLLAAGRMRRMSRRTSGRTRSSPGSTSPASSRSS
jgi:hypothetical protein